MSSPGTPTHASGRRKRRYLHGLLYVLLLAAGIFAAWQVHLLWFAPKPRPGSNRLGVRPGATPEMPGGDYMELLRRPHMQAGLREFAGEPGGIGPPAQARRRSGFEGEVADTRHEQVSYSYGGTLDAAVAHYTRALGQAGFAVRERRGDGQRRLVARQGRRAVVASLRKRRGPDGTQGVSIVVTAIAPAETGGPALSEPFEED
jgi:hypothetical protein